MILRTELLTLGWVLSEPLPPKLEQVQRCPLIKWEVVKAQAQGLSVPQSTGYLPLLHATSPSYRMFHLMTVPFRTLFKCCTRLTRVLKQ